jgi:hypothetical protein
VAYGTQSGQLSIAANGYSTIFAAVGGGVPGQQVTLVLQLESGPAPMLVKSNSATVGPFIATEIESAQASGLTSAGLPPFLCGWDELYLYAPGGACTVNVAIIPTTTPG